MRGRYAKLKTEYESHPGYYADKYKDASGFEKALTGILGSTIATVPVVAETTSAALKEAETKLRAEDYTAALQAEEIAKNKMNDYANSYFGFYDMIDQDELDRLTQEYQKASDYRKSLEAKYEKPVNMDSWGMDLMEEAAWLKNSATENLEGFGKVVADTAINVGQDVALTPLLLGGAKTYIAGVAANAAAEDMFEQTAKGRAPHEALVSGALTAGGEVAKNEISKIKTGEKILNVKPGEKIKVKVKDLWNSIKTDGAGFAGKVIKKGTAEGTKETAQYLMDFLLDKVVREPEAEFDWQEFAEYVASNRSTTAAEKRAEKLLDLIEAAWNELG